MTKLVKQIQNTAFLPPGRYWIDLIGETVVEEFHEWLKSMQPVVKVASSQSGELAQPSPILSGTIGFFTLGEAGAEDFSEYLNSGPEQAFVVFETPVMVPWPREFAMKVGYPDLIMPGQKVEGLEDVIKDTPVLEVPLTTKLIFAGIFTGIIGGLAAIAYPYVRLLKGR